MKKHFSFIDGDMKIVLVVNILDFSQLFIMGTGRCGGGRYGGGHYGGGRYGGGRYGGAFQFWVDATAEPPDTHITMDATAG